MAFENLLNPKTFRLIDWFLTYKISRQRRAIAARRISNWQDLRHDVAVQLMKNPPPSERIAHTTAICNAAQWMIGKKCIWMHHHNRMKEFSHERLSRSYIDQSVDIEEWERQYSMRELVEKMLKILDFRSAEIVRLLYGIGGAEYTLEQVGRIFGIGGERVRQIEQASLRRMGRQFAEHFSRMTGRHVEMTKRMGRRKSVAS